MQLPPLPAKYPVAESPLDSVDLTIMRLHRWLGFSAGIVANPLARIVSANVLSVLRALCAIPVVVITLLDGPLIAAVGFYVVGWSLDLVDGAVAKERERLGFDHDADFGEFIDVVCDKCLLLPTLAVLTRARFHDGEITWQLLFLATLGVSILLEAGLLAKRVIDYRAGRVNYAPMPSGKLKVALQAGATTILLASFANADSALAKAGLVLLAVSVPMSAWSIWTKLAAGVPAN
jgi:phosphatidylglycerophosphate synthase